jgi:hypothetical protein
MLRQLMVDVQRFLENGESRNSVQYALALALIIVIGVITMVLIDRSGNKTS